MVGTAGVGTYYSFVIDGFVVGTFTDGVFLEALLVAGDALHHEVVKHLWRGVTERGVAWNPRQKPRVQSETATMLSFAFAS